MNLYDVIVAGAGPAGSSAAIHLAGNTTLIVETGGVFVFAAFWLVKSFEIRTAVRLGHPSGERSG